MNARGTNSRGANGPGTNGRARHIELVAGAGLSPALAELVRQLARRHRVVAGDATLGPPIAVLARVGVEIHDRVARAVPVARWIEPSDLATCSPEALAGAAVAIAPSVTGDDPALAALAAAAGVTVELVPQPSIDGSAWWPVSPFVRRRWRRRLGLPERFVAEVGTPGAVAVDNRTAADALFTCSAAIVGPGHVLPALALGTPTICATAAAEAFGIVDGVHAVVADGSTAAREQAEALAGDDERAAALGRAARALVTERHDVAATARRVCLALGLGEAGTSDVPAVGRLASALVELGTPTGSAVTRRVGLHVASLGPTAAASAAGAFRW